MRRRTKVGKVTAAVQVATPLPAMAVTPSMDGEAGKAAQHTLQALPAPPAPELIRRRAYEKWERAGRPAGDGVRFWLEAERELLQTA